jgi:nucleotide-binding universal stress UspA family protein
MGSQLALTLLGGSEADAACLELALAVGRELGAHIEAFYPGLDPMLTAPLIGDGVPAALTAELIEAAQREEEQRGARARAQFEAWQAASGVLLRTAPEDGPELTASWREECGCGEREIVLAARAADLVVAGLPAHERSPALLHALLFGSGRPVLCAPPGWRPTLLRHVAVLWNGSAQAARAVGDAMRLLRGAGEVTLLMASEDHAAPPAGRALARRLAWCGIAARERPVPVEGRSAGAALLEAAMAAGADLVVMGAYGHSRVRELVLGGVTRHALAEARLPLWLSH